MIEINLYNVYKLIILGLTLGEFLTIINRIIPLIKYSKYLKYSKFIPHFLTAKLTEKGGNIIKKQIKQQQKDLIINGILLIILLSLNIFLWQIS